jgi:subtilisin family serine protease
MATPEVAGVAALILSQHPLLTATELKALILGGVTKYEGLQVFRPGTQTLMPFVDLSASGGILNAYNSLRLAIEKYGR